MPVYHEFLTVRVIRTERWLYQKAFLAGDGALYDLDTDPQQRNNLLKDPEYVAQATELDGRLEAFFAAHADPRYDLWKGGTGKLRLFGRDDVMFSEAFPDWQAPGLGFAAPPSAVNPAPRESVSPRPDQSLER